MPKTGIVLLVTAFVVFASGGGAVVARAQEVGALRAELRLKESVQDRGSARIPDGSFVLSVAARNAPTAGLTSVSVAAGDVNVTFPIRRGRFLGRIHEGDVDVRASVLAKRGRVTVRMEGTVRDGGGSVFGAQAFNACSDASHWDGTVYGIESATLTLGDTEHTIPVGIAGRSDRRRRGTGRFDIADDDLYRVTLNALGRIVGDERARAEVQFVPRVSTDRWDGRLRGQVLVSNADTAVLKMSLDAGEPARVDPFDAEALDISPTIEESEGVAARSIDGFVVRQIRFDTAVPAPPGPHVATAIAEGTDLQGSEVARPFLMPENAPPLVMDVDAHALEVRFDGLVRAWGDNQFGVVGNGLFRRNPKSPVPLPGPRDVVSVGAGQFFSVAVDGFGDTWLWGRYDDNDPPYGSFPALFGGLPTLVAIDAGTDHALGLDDVGRVWTFGKNGSGQLGDGTTQSHTREPHFLAGMIPFSAVAAGHRSSVALDIEGDVWAWGAQNVEGIGDGTRPVLVEGLPEIKAVDTRGRDADGTGVVSLALTIDGNVWTWGGPSASDATPSRILGLRNIVAISCGGSHDLALGLDGTVWAWGGNFAGQLGDGTRAGALVPVQVRDLRRIVRISAGVRTSFAVDLDGATWMFGDTSDFLGDWGTRTLPVLAPREFVPGSYKIPEEFIGAK
jgi:alpha-tubulin suppressor-like RCC1 family protein